MHNYFVLQIHTMLIFNAVMVEVFQDHFLIQRIVNSRIYTESIPSTTQLKIVTYGIQSSTNKKPITNKFWNSGDYELGVFPLEVIVI